MNQCFRGILFTLITLGVYTTNGQNVSTQHNDLSRTGWYPNETVLNTTNVNQNTFGLTFNYTVDDKIFAQPLVITGVNIPGIGIKNVMYVVTMNNSVYAFDADVNTPAYWFKNFNASLPGGGNCGNCRPPVSTEMHPSLCYGAYPDFNGNIGIVGTPVIDPSNNTMYFVSKTVDPTAPGYDNHTFTLGHQDEYTYTNSGFHQYLHAIDLSTGQDKPNSPVEITATATGTGDGQVGGIIKFDPRRQFDRAGLALNNGKIYIAFAAHCDFDPCHGWIMKYDETSLHQDAVFITTPNDGRGGSWMSGGAPAIDAAGNIYFTTGNSLNEDNPNQPAEHNIYNSDPTDPANRGESVVKLSPNLTISDWFTPFDYLELNDADKDFGIQVMLLPGTGLAMTGCKDDSLYLFDQNNLTHFDPTKNNTTQRVFVQSNATMHSSFAYFGGPTAYAYQFSENTQVKAYPVTAGGLGAPTINTAIVGGNGSVGGFMSVSSNGADPATGILWVYQADYGCDANSDPCHATLHALNASNITTELWNSNIVPADNIPIYNKLSCPTIALGKVYVAANTNHIYVYGAKANTTCINNVAQGKTATAGSSKAGNPPSAAIDGSISTDWISNKVSNSDSITVDLGASFDICKIAIIWNATGFAKAFDLKMSLDNINYTTTHVTGNTSAYSEFDNPVSARYVRMKGVTRGTGVTSYAINEFQVYGSPTSNICNAPVNLIASSGATIFSNQDPGASQDLNTPSIEAGVRFRASVNGVVKGIRFNKNLSDNGTHIGELFTNTGALLASANFTNETPGGWQEVLFNTPVAVTAGTTYVAAYYSSNGFYTGIANYFTAPVVNGPLTALQDGTDGANGIYLSAHGFPTNTFQSANYFVEPVFSTSTSPVSENLTWDPIFNAAKYYINYRPNLSSSWISRTSTTNSIDIGALSCGSLYYYTVQADCGSGQSDVSNGSFTTADCGATTCDILPTRYYNVDLGDIGIAGNTCFDNSVHLYTLTGSGNDIGGNSDQFQIAYTTLDIADYDLTGRIVDHIPANASSKTGIMVRDSLTNTSRYAYVAFMNNKFIFESRATPSGPSTTITAPGNYSLPYWAKISKTGTTYTAYISPDGSTWTKIGGPLNLNFGNNASNTPRYSMAVTSANNSALSTGKIDNFSIGQSAPLPIRLVSFNATNVNDDHVLITWSTSMEHLVDYYEIERSSDNFKSFEPIGQVKAVGESEITQNYSLIDPQPSSGNNYYRLKEMDKDDNFYYSAIVKVKFNVPDGLDIYPNPAEEFTTISTGKELIAEVRMYDALGKLVQTTVPDGSISSYRLSLTGLSKGIYIIRVKTTKGNVYREKLVRQ